VSCQRQASHDGLSGSLPKFPAQREEAESLDTLGELNWLAVILAAIAFLALGAVWYAPPVFGRAWQRAAGVETPEGTRPGIAYYIGPIATCLLSTVPTATLALATGTDTFGEAIVLGLVVGIGFAAAVAFVGGIFDPHQPLSPR
jgi:ABC-type dipeptide/oligopeptide/nickel transport system permease subunit